MNAHMEIVKAFSFEAAHHFTHMPEGHGYQRLHGHSYQVEVGIAGTPDPATGWIADLGGVAREMEAVREQLDHNLLNEVEGLENPSLENIAVWIARELGKAFPGLAWVRVGRPSCNEACLLRLNG